MRMYRASSIFYWILSVTLIFGVAFAAYIPKAASTSLILASIVSVIAVIRNSWPRKEPILFISGFIAPISAIFIASLIRGEFTAREFDSASRLLLGIPLFLYLIKQNRSSNNKLISGLVVALILAGVFVDPNKTEFYGNRYATAYADVNSLAAILVTFLAITVHYLLNQTFRNSTLFYLMLSGVFIGGYILAKTGARGPILVFFITLFLIFALYIKDNKCRAFGRTSIVLATLLIPPFLLFLNDHTFQQRIYSIATEIFDLTEKTDSTETSSGIRLSMLKLSLGLFLEKPVAGWGDIRYSTEINDSIFSAGVSSPVIQATQLGGPHNEFAARALNSGSFGLVASLFFHFLPILLLFQKKHARLRSGFAVKQALVLISTLFLLGFTLETFSLKYMTSLNTILLAVVLSEAYKERSRDTKSV